MTTLNVRREYWSLSELAQRYGFTESALDLRRAIMSEVLRPCMWFARNDLVAVRIQDGHLSTDPDGPKPTPGWRYPVQSLAQQTDNFECIYTVVSDGPTIAGAGLWALPEPISLTQVLMLAVVFDEDVRAAEDAQRADPERELTVREEKTRDCMLVSMAAELFGWDPASEKSTGLTSLVELCRETGLPVSYNSAKRHLRLAWDRCPPKLNAAGDKTTPYAVN